MDSNIIIRKCEYCNRKMQPINTGANHYYKDWKERKYHKSCYKKIMDDYKFTEMLKLSYLNL